MYLKGYSVLRRNFFFVFLFSANALFYLLLPLSLSPHTRTHTRTHTLSLSLLFCAFSISASDSQRRRPFSPVLSALWLQVVYAVFALCNVLIGTNVAFRRMRDTFYATLAFPAAVVGER